MQNRFSRGDKSVGFTLLWNPIKSWLPIFGIVKIRVHLGVSNHANSVQTVYPCVCDRPEFQLWTNPAPPTTSVSLRRSQLGRKSAARRGWSAPDALGRSGGLKHGCSCLQHYKRGMVRPSADLEQCPTFNVAHGHLDGAFASFPNVVLAVIVGNHTTLQHEPARLPAWWVEDSLGILQEDRLKWKSVKKCWWWFHGT